MNYPHFHHWVCKNKQRSTTHGKGQNSYNIPQGLQHSLLLFFSCRAPSDSHSNFIFYNTGILKSNKKEIPGSLCNIVLKIPGKDFIEAAYDMHTTTYWCRKATLCSWLRKCGNCSFSPSACGNCTTQCQQGASSKLQQLPAPTNSNFPLHYTHFKSCLWIINSR